jgi:hypothetical protein
VATQNRTPKNRAKSAAVPSTKQLDRIAGEFEAQPAQLSKNEVEVIEENFVNAGVIRRMALGTLSLSGSEIRDAVIDDREGALELAKLCAEAREYATHLKKFAGIMETASVRLMMGLCFREDGPEVLREGASAVQP